MDDTTRWTKAAGSSTRMHYLQQRQRVLSTIREDLYSQGFIEVETPLLVKKTTPDAFIDSIPAGDGFLITSTEYQIKRLLSGGFDKVFTLSKNFRAFDQGRYHSQEFTMLEWGRSNESLRAIEEDTVRFIRKAFRELYPDKNSLYFNGREINVDGDWERLTVRDAFKIYLGMENLGDFSLNSLLKSSEKARFALPSDQSHDHSFVISFLLDSLQTHLGKEKPAFLNEWPSFLTSSAPISEKDPFTAERSELYIGGIEIANGFPFLTDSEKQRQLFSEQINTRMKLGKPSVAFDEKYIHSLNHLPQGAGMALGIDRLVMVLTGTTQLSDVQAFGWDEL